ncbi:MAG TPA: plastocyanin/azurin family copper-binding protein [Chitinophagaceae bacterium]|nr:plastocyanin/azurin family copper-binding protein [Chitinophagaceae bacterium]
MKKILLPFLCLILLKSQATTVTVNVSNFQFSSPNINVKVGDVVHWVWASGNHTTTSLFVPAGAASWDAPLVKSGDFFDYTVTVTGSYSYQCDNHPAQMQGTITATVVTPVTLSVFNIIAAGGKASLHWTTLTELNADHFSIRKSLDGSDFKEIAQIPAAGNSSIQKDYSFVDDKISSSTRYIYYALAIVDKDGQTQLSPIKIYKNKTSSAKLIISLSPNPISEMGHVMLKFNADKPGTMSAKLIDAQGKLVLQTDLSAVTGVNNGHIHLGGISKGTYTFQFTLDGISESYRIIKN